MKKRFYLHTLLCILSILVPSISFAEIYLPKTVSVGDRVSYDAGTVVDLSLTDSARTIGLQKSVEYGIAKTTKPEDLTFFEIITTEHYNLAAAESMPKLSAQIPNILATDSSSTYVVYVKFFEKNNPENESFYFTKEFSIRANNTPFIQVANVNLLQSTGVRHDTLQGPNIYSPSEAALNKELATSTSVEITFESNQDSVIAPRIVFSKMRSDSFHQEIELNPITIKKGKTYAVIPLPTFNYEPGVYIGALEFGSNLMRNKVDLQYIVAGDTVSVGTVSVTQIDGKDAFSFEIFGRPLDMDRSDYVEPATTSTSTPDMYKAQIDFISAKGEVVYTTQQDVDFALNSFSVQIPPEYKDIPQIHVTVHSLAGKMVFEGTKDVNYVAARPASIPNINLIIFIAIYVLLTIIVIVAILKRHVKTAIFCIVLLAGLFVSHKVLALYDLDAYKVAGAKTLFRNEGVGMIPSVFLRDDVPNTVYTCGEAIPFVFKVYYLRCTNSTPTVKVAFSWTSFANPVYSKIPNARDGDTYSATYGTHKFYKSYSAFVYKDLPPPPATTNSPNLYMTVAHSGGGGTDTGYVKYQIPIKTTCGDTPLTCACSGRTQVCSKNGAVVSSTTNATQCALSASCSYSQSGDVVTFSIATFNSIGALSYKDTDTGVTYQSVTTKPRVGTSTVTHKVTVTDAHDNTQAYASCTVSGTATPDICGTPGQPACPCGSIGQPACTACGGPGQPACTVVDSEQANPTIESFDAVTAVVEKGKSCEYVWYVSDVNDCVVKVNNVAVPVAPGSVLTGPVSVPTTNGLNQLARLTCIANASTTIPAVTVSTTTVCKVVAEIQER